MRRCKVCGTENLSENMTCQNCGAMLPEDEDYYYDYDFEDPADRKRRHRKNAVIFLVLIAIIVAIVIYAKSKPKPTPPANSTTQSMAESCESETANGNNSNNEAVKAEKRSDVIGKDTEFYGILCNAYKSKDKTKADIEKLKNAGFTDAVFCTTTKWDNFNDELWYVVVAGRYTTKELANANLPAVKKFFRMHM